MGGIKKTKLSKLFTEAIERLMSYDLIIRFIQNSQKLQMFFFQMADVVFKRFKLKLSTYQSNKYLSPLDGLCSRRPGSRRTSADILANGRSASTQI